MSAPGDTGAMTLTDFLLERIAEDEEMADRSIQVGDKGAALFAFGQPDAPRVMVVHPARMLAECAAKRAIVDACEQWPVLVETPPEFEQVGGDPNMMTFRMSQQIQWQTTQEYRARFGDEPPAAPMLRHLAAVYSDHPDYDESWRP